MFQLSRLVCVAAAAAGLMAALPAHAFLGGAYASVATDRAHFAAQLKTTAAATHTLHTLTLANGGMVREFSRPDGTVFAVTWRAPGRPDLRQLLGEHFTVFQADNAQRLGRARRAPLRVNRSDFVVVTGGHSGAFWGIAYLPQSAPAGFSASELK
jgi:hypothetical protein